MSRHAALLRGVNVGGNNKLPMSELAALFRAAGCGAVETYIQSGNVVFTAPASLAKQISATIAQQIEERFGLRIPVVIRSAEELRGVVENNPFLLEAGSEDWLHVYFLEHEPQPEDEAKLDRGRSPSDRFIVRNKEVYLLLPSGMGRSKLTNAYFDAKLKTVSTARNWRTVLRLLKMLES